MSVFLGLKLPVVTLGLGEAKVETGQISGVKVETIEAQVAIRDMLITTEMIGLNLEVVIILKGLGVI